MKSAIFTAGALVGVASSYLGHWSLTYGQLTILFVAGIVLAVKFGRTQQDV